MMRPCFAPTLVLAVLLAPELACTDDPGPADTDTTGTSSTATEVTTGDPVTCGNGSKQTGEDCDDGNNMPGDGCDPECRIEAGQCDNDGVKEDGEACDDGNLVDTDACLSTCNVAGCGDGFVHGKPSGSEECDDKLDNGDTRACTTACKLATCGDGLLHTGVEECDAGSMNGDSAACTSQCKAATCGDGFVQAGEEDCDDGNAAVDDACTPGCTKTACGDGIVQTPNGGGVVEVCDDGNDVETDDCDAQCQPIIHRKVFLSSKTYLGNASGLNGLTGADAICNTIAGEAQLTGKFKAWLSDSSTSPAKHFDTTFTGVYELIDGTIVAQGWMGLGARALAHAINKSEVNTVFDDGAPVWTNTAPNGEALGLVNCADWKGAGVGAVGLVTAAAPDWTASVYTGPCGGGAHIYCFEDPGA